MKGLPVTRKEKPSPERKCILSGEVSDKSQLIRFVMAPDGMLTPDLAEKLPGRGLWMKADRLLIEQAVSNKQMQKSVARAIKGPFQLGQLPGGDEPSAFADLLETLLRRRVLDRLGIEQRASHIVTGFDKIQAALGKKARPAVLFHADDAGKDGRQKTSFSVQRHADKQVPEYTFFTRDELSQALGKDNAVHVLLLKGAAIDKLQADLGRLNGIRRTCASGS